MQKCCHDATLNKLQFLTSPLRHLEKVISVKDLLGNMPHFFPGTFCIPRASRVSCGKAFEQRDSPPRRARGNQRRTLTQLSPHGPVNLIFLKVKDAGGSGAATPQTTSEAL